MANLRRASLLATQGADELNHGERDYGRTNSKQHDEEDDDDEGAFDEDGETALDAGDYDNFWEGMLEKQGKAMLNKKWRQRWCSVRGSRFEYFEDHTKTKSLGVVPLEMCTWTHNNPKLANQIEMKTIGREAKSGESEGRTFFFRFLVDSDRQGFISALARAAYLRNREVFLEACRLGDAFTVHQVLMRMRIMEGEEGSSFTSAERGGMGKAVMSGGAMRVCRPVAFCSDYDPAEGLLDGEEDDGENSPRAMQLAKSAELGTPGVLDPTALDLLLHEAHVNEQQSPLHLALKSCDVAPWGDAKEYESLLAARGGAGGSKSSKASSGSSGSSAVLPLSALAGHGPHPLACARLLLKPVWVEKEVDAALLGKPSTPFQCDASLRFLLETIDSSGETPLMACLHVKPFRSRVDATAEAEHASRRSSSSEEQPLYQVDPYSLLSGGCGNLGWGTGGLACAAALLVWCGARPSAVNDQGMNALHVACGVPEHLALLQPLLVLGVPESNCCDAETQDANGCSPLMHAAMANNAAGAEALLALKADIHAKSWKNGYTALSWAVRCAADSVCLLLLDEERRQRLVASAPKLLSTAAAVAVAPGLLGDKKKEEEDDDDDASGWLDEEDAAFMASAPKPKLEKKKDDDDNDDGDGTDGEDDDDDDEAAAFKGSGDDGPVEPLASVVDSRGDCALHLLARAYVAKSREQQRLKNATLGQYKTILEALLGAPGGAESVDVNGYDSRTPLLIMSRAEAEPVNISLVMEAFVVLLENGRANVKAVTPGGHTPLHLAADVGNHALCKALVDRGADPNAQSTDGVTPYGYVRTRLQQAASNKTGNGGGGVGGGSALQATRMLQRTADVLLECGAYKMERSEVSIDHDSTTAQWMKGADGSLQLKAATAPALVAYLCRSTTPFLDLDSWSWQFHRTLRDDKEPFVALAVLLRLLKQTYESVAPGEANSVKGTVAIHCGVWRVLNRLLAERPELFPHPAATANTGSSSSSSSSSGGGGGGGRSAAASAATTATKPGASDPVEESIDNEVDEYEGHFASSASGEMILRGANGSSCGDGGTGQEQQQEKEEQQQAQQEGVVGVRRALRDLVASTVRSGLPDAFGLITYKKPLELPFVYLYARKAADSGDPIWTAFLSRNPLAHVAPLAPRRCHLPSPAADHPTYHTLAQVVGSALSAPNLTAHHYQPPSSTTTNTNATKSYSSSSAANKTPSVFLRPSPPTAAEREKGILAYSPQQVGQHLTVLTHMLFSHVPPKEFLDKRYSRGRPNSPHFHLLKDFVNRAQYNFISECVRRADLRERSSVLALLVRSAEACLQMNNYDSAMLLVGVLCDSSVHRLRKTWEMVEQLIPRHWEAVQHAVGMAGRSLEQTMAQLTADPPCMPAVGFIIKNLVNLEEREEFSRSPGAAMMASQQQPLPPPEDGSPAPPPPPPPPALVNFERVRSVGAVLEMVRACQRVPYPFADKCHSGLLSLLLAPPQYADEDATYEQSLRVEARAKAVGGKK